MMMAIIRNALQHQVICIVLAEFFGVYKWGNSKNRSG